MGVKEIWQFIDEDRTLKIITMFVTGCLLIFLGVVWVKAFILNPSPYSVKKDLISPITADSTEIKEKKEFAKADDSINKAVVNKEEYKKPKKMEEKNKAGDTYNVKSINQQGGYTVGKVEIHVKDQETADDLDIPINDNFTITFDPMTNRFQCQPRVGSWKQPYIGVFETEKDAFKKFGNESLIMNGASNGLASEINNKKLYGAACGLFGSNDHPATSNRLLC
jgi:hypothetical protein